MDNINIAMIRPNYWVVKADTKRFGTQAIMFEGTYDECVRYLDRTMFKERKQEQYRVNITGGFPEYEVKFDNDWFIFHSNGFEERDWAKVGL